MTYPPQQPSQPGWAQQPPQAPPPKKTSAGKIVGLGCLGIVGLFVVIGVGAALAGGVKTSSPTQKSTAAPVPASTGSPAGGGTAPAPADDGDKLKDVEITNCTVDPTLNWPSAEVKITNHSSKASNYVVQVEFLDASGTRISEGMAATNGLAPGQAAVQKAAGTAEANGKVSCRVVDVTRYASAG